MRGIPNRHSLEVWGQCERRGKVASNFERVRWPEAIIYRSLSLWRSCPLIVIAFSIFLGCGSSSPEITGPREVVKASLPVADESERELLNQAQQHYERGLYSVARERFQTLRNSYPDGVFAEYALLKVADSQFFAGAFSEAVPAYEEYITTYPGALAVPYALYQQARSSMVSIKGAGRDTAPIEKAVELLDRLRASYPNSPFARQAIEFKNEALEILAMQDQMIGSFYEKQDELGAARYRESKRRERVAAKEEAAR